MYPDRSQCGSCLHRPPRGLLLAAREQMIPDLTCLLRLDERPARRQAREPVARGAFDVDVSCGCQPAPALEQFCRALQQSCGEGGIEKHDVERPRRCGTPEKLQCV